jgi:hypothetical protein
MIFSSMQFLYASAEPSPERGRQILAPDAAEQSGLLQLRLRSRFPEKPEVVRQFALREPALLPEAILDFLPAPRGKQSRDAFESIAHRQQAEAAKREIPDLFSLRTPPPVQSASVRPSLAGAHRSV